MFFRTHKEMGSLFFIEDSSSHGRDWILVFVQRFQCESLLFLYLWWICLPIKKNTSKFFLGFNIFWCGILMGLQIFRSRTQCSRQPLELFLLVLYFLPPFLNKTYLSFKICLKFQSLKKIKHQFFLSDLCTSTLDITSFTQFFL